MCLLQWSHADYLLLLQKGRIVYQGIAQNALDHFADTGFPCPVSALEPQAHWDPQHTLDTLAPSTSDAVCLFTAFDIYLQMHENPGKHTTLEVPACVSSALQGTTMLFCSRASPLMVWV
jgi:hypothetical protein